MDAREQITALREKLRYHNEKYYNDDAPEISDYEYDMMQRELRALEAEHPEFADANSPTQRVGGTASGRFAKVTHAYPLESLQDVFSFDELGEFYTRVENTVGKAEYVVEYKIDGLSVALEYVDGGFNCNNRVRIAEFNRIVDQIVEHLLDFVFVSKYGQMPGGKNQFDRYLLLCACAFKRGSSGTDHIMNVERFPVQQKFLCVKCI